MSSLANQSLNTLHRSQVNICMWVDYMYDTTVLCYAVSITSCVHKDVLLYYIVCVL